MKRKLIIIIFLFNTLLQAKVQSNKFVIGAHGDKLGLFSLFLGALNKLAWSKKNNRVPVIHWGKNCLYFQSSGYHGSTNVWDYYFSPVSNHTYNIGDYVYTRYQAPDGFAVPHNYQTYNSFFHSSLKHFLNRIVKEDIKIRPRILQKVNNFFNQRMHGKKNVGIHLRGTDKYKESKPVNPLIILARAKAAASKKFGLNNVQFFIATDEMKLLNLAKKFFGNKAICYKAHRSLSKEALHSQLKGQSAILGEEVLIETLLLSKCDLFVHTLSNVATAVMIFNPRLSNIYMVPSEPNKNFIFKNSKK